MIKKIKSLSEIAWNVTEKEYRKDPSYSYSTVARYNREGFNNLYKLYESSSSPSLVFGSLVDALLTGSKEELECNYLISDFTAIPDSIKTIIEYLHSNYNATSLHDIKEEDIIKYTEIVGYQKNWLPKTRVKVILEKGSDYYSLLTMSFGKMIVDNNTYLDAVNCVNTLRQANNTKYYFESNNPFDNSIERLFQLKFKGTYNGIPIRCMSDLLIVDHVKKTITPVDLKTSYKPEWEFYKSFIDWNYWIQAQLYWYIIRQNLDKDDVYKDYELLDYEFIVISNNTKIPLVWQYPDTKKEETLYYGKNKEIECRNWRNILIELNYYLKNNSKVPISIKGVNVLNEWLNK